VVPIADDGVFYFQPVRPATYIVMIIGGDAVLHLEKLVVLGNHNPTISLPPM
jgi:hypothetical protein